MEESSLMPVTFEELRGELVEDRFCKQAGKTAQKPGTYYEHDRCRSLARESALDEMLQHVVPKGLRARVLHRAHSPRVAGHPGRSKMYYIFQWKYCWLHKANEMF